MDAFGISLAVFAAAVGAAIWAEERGSTRVFRVAKPAATCALFPLLDPGAGGRGRLVFAAGLALAAAGDIALLFEGAAAFMAGLVLFLLAHLAYAAGFVSAGGVGAPWAPFVGLALFGGTSVYLAGALLAGAPSGLRRPIAVYAAAITTMVAMAFATIGGPWPERAAALASVGALAFYVSDGNLAWTRFVRPYPHAGAVTLALYWAGQLGIVLGARAGTR